MSRIKQELSYLMLGQQGGENRIKILEKLKERSYNTNQLAKELDLNYRTVEHHLKILLNHDLIESSGEGYGNVYFLTDKMEENYDLLQDMKDKLEMVSESPRIYQKVVEQTKEGIIILDENKDVILLNKSSKEITGYEEEALLGKNVEHLLKSDIHRSLEQVVKEEDFVEKSMKIETNFGETKTVKITMDYFYFDGKEHKGFLIIMRDISEEIKQRDILDVLMEHSGMTMAYLDTDFDLVYVNSAYAERTDHSIEELVGKNHFGLFPNEETEELFNEAIEKKETIFIENMPLFNSDNENMIHWTLEPINNGDGEIQGVVLTLCEHP